MTKPAERPREEALEHGSILFLYRPRVETPEVTDLGDVQRLLVLLSAEDAQYQRLIAVGRKRLSRSAKRERFWGFVDLVLTPHDMKAALGAQVYGTKTRGLRHLPAAVPIARGRYSLTAHGEHSHLHWSAARMTTDPIAFEAEVEPEGNYLLSVANPDLEIWGLQEPPELQTRLFDELELHVAIPSPFPPAFQQRFGNRKYVAVDDPRWLDHPGAELLFIGT
jgi:hypothetical protein